MGDYNRIWIRIVNRINTLGMINQIQYSVLNIFGSVTKFMATQLQRNFLCLLPLLLRLKDFNPESRNKL